MSASTIMVANPPEMASAGNRAETAPSVQDLTELLLNGDFESTTITGCDFDLVDEGPTPAIESTWASIKDLYR